MSAPDVVAALERAEVLADAHREVFEAARALASAEARDFAGRYYDWLRLGRPGAGQPKPPRCLPNDAVAIVKERVTDRTLALRRAAA